MSWSEKSTARVVIADTPDKKNFWHAEIDRAYRVHAWDALQRAIGSSQMSQGRKMALWRLSELERLYAARHGAPCLADDDAGREYLEIAAHHIAHLRGEVERHIIAWCALWAPWMPSAEAAEMAKRVAAKPRKWKAASLGNELNLTPEERAALNIGTFRPAGWTKKDLDKASKAKHAARAKQRRQSAAKDEGRILRAKPGRPRRTGPTPWERLGMSRATYYRRGKLAETNNETEISAHQGGDYGTHEFSSHAEPSGSLPEYRSEDVVPFGAKSKTPARTRHHVVAGEDGVALAWALKQRPLPACHRAKVTTATEQLKEAA